MELIVSLAWGFGLGMIFGMILIIIYETRK
jgi:hypothetical protein